MQSGKKSTKPKQLGDELATKFPGLAIPNDVKVAENEIDDAMAALEALAPSKSTDGSKIENKKREKRSRSNSPIKSAK